jgi:hypothetical protein
LYVGLVTQANRAQSLKHQSTPAGIASNTCTAQCTQKPHHVGGHFSTPRIAKNMLA